MVKVWPKDDAMRKLLKHPSNRVGFRDDGGSADWPDDQFTTRRIMDGDVVTDDPNPPASEVVENKEVKMPAAGAEPAVADALPPPPTTSKKK